MRILDALWINFLKLGRAVVNGALTVGGGATVTGAGLVVGAPTGGDKGAGSVNAQTMFIKNLPVHPSDRYYDEYTAYSALSTAIPVDNTVPLSTEGTEVLSISVPIATATQRVRAFFRGFGGATSGNYITAALFRDTTCLDVSNGTLNANTWTTNLTCEVEEVPGVGTYTYSVRVGPASGSAFLNGLGAGQLFNGTSRATLIIDVYEP